MLMPKMIDKVSSWKFAEDFTHEPPVIRSARAAGEELGVESVTEATGGQLAAVAALTRAKSIVEVGTGAGVSALWLLSASEDSVLTTIDSEPEYQNVAKKSFQNADVAPARIRAISGRASAVLKNMAEGGYDLVFLDLEPQDMEQLLDSAISLAKPGGAVVIAHAMWRDRLANPTVRDEDTVAMRAIHARLSEQEDFVSTLSLVGDGLLIAVKR